MKRFFAVFLGLVLCASVAYKVNHGVSAAQAAGQFSSQPQMRYAASVAIPLGTPVVSTTSGCGQSLECVTPTTTSGFIAGIAITAAPANGAVYVAQYGAALCSFDSPPVLGDAVTVVPGFCHDESSNTRLSISLISGYVGRVIAVPDQSTCPSTYCGYVNIIAPATNGLMIPASQMDPATMPAYVKANQNTSAGPQGIAGKDGAVGPASTVAGPMGPSGAASTVAGPMGPTGPTGPASTVAGPQGIQGIAGAASTVAGPQGPAGVAGPAGAASTVPGPAGPAGATGAASTIPGPTGSTGLTGIAGSNGTAATVTLGTVTTLACGTNPTVANSGTTAAAVFNFGLPRCGLAGVTSSIGGTALLLNGTTSGTASITGAVAGTPCTAAASSGALPASGLKIDCAVTASGVATVQLTALIALTPAASTYNVRVLQ